ncbi:MAG: MBOAT family O-acyltransferase [Pseudomonadota bacterium]
MLFNSLEYIAFLASITLAYFVIRPHWRIPLLLAASFFFYMQWDWRFVALIAFVSAVNFEAGRRIAASEAALERRFWLIGAITLSLGLLAFFKYVNFFADSVGALISAAGLPYLLPHLDLILPVGISFFTFQALSYTIDVYRGAPVLETNPARFALYVAFFPQLVAGPIERATTLLGQFRQTHRFEVTRLAEGGRLILWGLFKKVVIADRLAIYVNDVYAHPELHDGPTLLLATYFFAIQIYCDFSAYSDIAIGSARILGFNLMQNFNLPYLARSITEFWQRWHISLTRWFHAYVYVPLGGNRVPAFVWLCNVTAVFLLSGLWHGAQWTFVIWGALHAGYYLVERVVRAVLPARQTALRQALGMIVTFHAVVLAWVFFRAASLDDALLIIGRILTDQGGWPDWGVSRFSAMLNLGLIALLAAIQVLQARGTFSLYLSPSQVGELPRIAGYSLLLCGIALLGASPAQFLYFQF